MSKRELKQKFLDKIELFYRNFGNEWTIEELVSNPSQQEYLLNFLKVLEEKNIVSLKSDGRSFIIKDLPSNHKDLLI
jgi:hypothetical protein